MAQTLTVEDVRQKIRVVKAKPGGKDAPVAKACSSSRVTALDEGINLNRPDGGTLRYADMSLLVVFRLDIDPDTWYIDVFMYGQPAPFRLSQKAINYRQFLPEISQRSKDNFFTFLLLLIDRSDSVYIDENTLEFLKHRKPAGYPDFGLFEAYTRQLWHQLLTWMKFRCDSCGEVYWVDEAKVSPDGAKTKCVKCRHIITVKRREKPQPLHADTKKRKTVPCPHCRYENQEGSQFCVMCQEALIDFTSRAKAKTQKSRSDAKDAEATSSDSAEGTDTVPSGESPKNARKPASETPSPEAPDLSDLPLQARSKNRPTFSLGELDTALQDDMHSVVDKFGWYGKFAMFMQVLSFLLMAGGFLIALYIYFAYQGPPPPEAITPDERFNYSVISAVIGVLASLIGLVVSNIISLNLQIERNTKLTALLLQRLISKNE